MRQWVQQSLNTYEIPLGAQPPRAAADLSSFYRGHGTWQHSPLGRRMVCSLWRKVDGRMLPAGLAAIACWGVLHGHEFGEIRLADQKLVLTRCGSCLNWQRNGKPIGSIHYSRRLRVLHCGPAALWREDRLLGTLTMPLIGPSSRQASDCFGTIALANGRVIRFLLNLRDAHWVPFSSRNGDSGYFASHPPLESSPLFQPDVKDELAGAETDQVHLFLGAAMWARLFFTYA